ncbi:unnamed protein product [Rotaria sp. Silwood1]|nr:unnamed protein product [Rotaria sp. Silwood1]CAF3517446.1 unnamed protein product [Rotaria sp. Silwood1]CAF3552978.1 unnamed protein product [Rotaria sp. Silwood1]CAF4538984.1 unnamed protein product [Rotaria sp. Silwood1]CAF4644004.1 unnamed protein product [Rotaria sp. Silwood1]
MKWNKDAKKWIVVAGFQGEGNGLRQLSNPRGLFVDALGILYVADSMNHRVMCYRQGAKEGVVIVGGNGRGAEANQLNELGDLQQKIEEKQKHMLDIEQRYLNNLDQLENNKKKHWTNKDCSNNEDKLCRQSSKMQLLLNESN